MANKTPSNRQNKIRTARISKDRWERLNRVDTPDAQVGWNAFSPSQINRSSTEGSSQSSQSQGSNAIIAFNETSPSVILGSIPAKRQPATKRQRKPPFSRNASKDDLLKSFANLNKKPTRKKKTETTSSSDASSEDPNASSRLISNSSPDFFEDGMDEIMFEASQRFEASLLPFKPSNSKIKETPKRIGSRCSSRTKSINNNPITSTNANISRNGTSSTSNSNDSLNEKFNGFTTKGNRITVARADPLDDFDEEDDAFLSQVPMP